ncbi:complement C1q tumor necrosis factor-related protein 1-like [Acipenser oxyrinchus oxyrinchus]|uniref:Complement C1q tumor necrosis factor-related protein 1-like n=1 Tax=Acipenser oxyrinchus oxyrinchus TaxID=40147 RepID=A0AAD8D765_ACIOX|nr:complement C1q tumor necrosis factor-related protein 1-like [Acipenser oxyrinchus oxyrinchus]
MLGFSLSLCVLILPAVVWVTCTGMVTDRYRITRSELDLENEDYRPHRDPTESDYTAQNQRARSRDGERGSQCLRCCDPGEEPRPLFSSPAFQFVPHINITILKGEKGHRGERGTYGKSGKSGSSGPRGPEGMKGHMGATGSPGEPCKTYYSAFSVGRKKALHSNDYYQPLIYDTEFVNLYKHFNMFSGKFYCYIPGVYYFSLNVHTWNQKETYLHLMKNEQELVVLYAQPSDRSIMQSQSLMLELEQNDEVWVRLFKGERENAIFSDNFDTYITFNGYLIKPKSDG